MDSGAEQLPDFSLTDDDLRRSGSKKWLDCPPDAIAAWIAELDVAPAPAIVAALHQAVDTGMFGYPTITGSALPEALADWLDHNFGWRPEPANVVLAGDAVVAVALAIEALCADAPVVVPVPCYPPFLAAVPRAGRRFVGVPCVVDNDRYVLDLDAVDAELAAGARTVLLTNPHNPLGRSWTRHELTALRQVVDRHGARLVSDEIHAPLVLPGATHVPYAAIDPERHITVIAASKAWNLPGLKCAQVITGSPADAAALRALPRAANRGVSSLGVAAAVAAYRHGDPWRTALVAHLHERRRQFGRLLATHLPQVAWRPMEATYFAWLEPADQPEPAATALHKGSVLLDAGTTYGPPPGTTPAGARTRSYDTFVRVNIGTSAERLERLVTRLAHAWS
jgi:cysteine-S-conjugate beta-lyase